MSRYYQGSKPFTWLRKKLKIEKPTALPWGGWEKWDEETKAKHPVGYFLTETLPDWLEWIPEHSIDYVNNFRYYFVNRFVEKTHYLRTGLKPGEWHEFETRMLHGCFEELIDFVEQEKAHMHMAFADKDTKDKFDQPWWARGWLFRWKRWRSPKTGIAHLQWEMTLDEPDENGNVSSPHQAVAARETLALYQWWKYVRPNREEPWVETGFRKFWDEMDAKYGDGKWMGFTGNNVMTKAEERKYNKLSKAVDELEDSRHQEDEDMLIRLVKLRRNLWT